MQTIIAFFERPEISRAVRRLFIVSLVFLVMADFFIDKHPFFYWENIPGFYALYGFIACSLIVAVSKLLGKYWLQKQEDYYE
ncbi:MAG: hypothetical protein HPY81_02030 [Firmicutes bacterium]|nr:hypothetical protein [Bacillota bacterium]